MEEKEATVREAGRERQKEQLVCMQVGEVGTRALSAQWKMGLLDSTSVAD